MNKITVNELFSGIGAQAAALKRIGVDFDVVSTSEIDKDAMLSYAAIHNNLYGISQDYNCPNAEYMANYLQERNIGYDFQKNKPYDWNRLINKKKQARQT